MTSDILLQNMHYVYCYISSQILYIIRCHALFVLKPLNLVHSKIDKTIVHKKKKYEIMGMVMKKIVKKNVKLRYVTLNFLLK